MPTNKEIIEKLTEQNDELENYFRNTIIPQLFIDAKLVLRKFTPPAMKQFNLSMADIGKPIEEIHDNFRFPTFMENVNAAIDCGEILEKEIQTSDMRWFQMNIIPYINGRNQQTNGVIVTFVDITYRIKDLKEMEKLVSDHETLLDALSHDIKNPLANIVLAVDQFKAMGISNQEGFTSMLGIVERALQKMRTLIMELTESREKEHRYKSHVELLNFEHILEDVRLTLNEEIKASGAVVHSKIDVGELTYSRRKLRSIIYNLLNNSIKYKSPERKPEIFITTTRQEDYITISIKDNGMGIAADKQDAVFSKYYRVDNAIEGSGIGLYLVKEFVESAGGKIELESKLGEGTEIRIFIKEQVKE